MGLRTEHVVDRVDGGLLEPKTVLNAKKADIHVDDLGEG
jgi:hypothetical protein